jgi:hypothetical protein
MRADDFAPVVRIFLRYAGAALVTRAGLSIDVTDPDIQSVTILLIGTLLSAANEAWYILAKKRGWRC